jgi:hypothetical protein
MNRVKVFLALAAVLGLVSMAGAANIEYRVLINGADLEIVTEAEVAAGVEFMVQIQVLVTENDLFGEQGGVLQYSADLDEQDLGVDALTPTRNWIPFPPPGDFGDSWASTSVLPMTNYAGSVDAIVGLVTVDVLGQTGAIAPGDFVANYNTFGSGGWSTGGAGPKTRDGTGTTLVLSPGSADSQLVYSTDGTVFGAFAPDSSSGDSVLFVPEPASMSLLVIGGVAALIRRKK